MGFRDGCDMALSYILFSVIRFFQFVMALVVCGLYGVDLHAANKQGKYSDGKWVWLLQSGYAVYVGFTLTCFVN